MDFSQNLLYLSAILSISGTKGQNFGTFMAKHMNAIQNYIMAGYGRGWDQCDVIAETNLRAVPHLIIKLQKLGLLDAMGYFHSHCLLVIYHVKRREDLEALVEFGKRVIMKKRLALVLRLGSDIGLDAVNRTRLPVLIAAVLNNGEEQFLCPVVGEGESFMQDHMCDDNYTSYKNKILRIGMLGMAPYLEVTNKSIDGIDYHLLQLLVKRMNFVANITIPKHLMASIAMVRVCI